MTTATKIVTSKAPVKEVIKDASMLKQKEMMAAHYDRLTGAPETGAKVASTFVPGNLNELIMCFDLINNLPEVNAIQSGLRRVSGSYVLEAEKIGHSEDVCTYVKSDIGMMSKGNIAPNGKKFPNPDVLLLPGMRGAVSRLFLRFASEEKSSCFERHCMTFTGSKWCDSMRWTSSSSNGGVVPVTPKVPSRM